MLREASYRAVIQGEMERRSTRNPSYSLRAFARDLGISAAGLSQVIHGRQNLSPRTSSNLARKLGLNTLETEQFCLMVESEDPRSERKRDLARLKLRKFSPVSRQLELDTFRIIADWYHFAILELTEIEGFQSTTAWIADQLGVHERLVHLAVLRLKRLGLLEETEGKWKQTSASLSTPSGVPSDAIKKFHDQVIGLAWKALYHQSVDERDISSVFIPINTDDLPRAKQKIREFRRDMAQELQNTPGKKRVYSLCVQFFDLQKRSRA